MTDKVQKIREEVERRIIFQKECIKNSYRLTGKPEEEIILEYKQLLSFIDSLPEEPVSDDLNIEAIKEELDKAVRIYTTGGDFGWGTLYNIACHFAKWQKEQDKETIEIAEDHAMFAGMKKMREQMMKDAIDGEIFDIFYPNGDCLEISAKIPEDKFQDGDKVKLIIIKKE